MVPLCLSPLMTCNSPEEPKQLFELRFQLRYKVHASRRNTMGGQGFGSSLPLKMFRFFGGVFCAAKGLVSQPILCPW